MSILSCSTPTFPLIVATFWSAALSADAQTADPADAQGRVLEEVIVTAQRRETHLFNVPVAVTAFDRAAIEALSLDNVAEVAQYTPNVVWNQSFYGAANFSSVFIRGVGQLANFFESSADPSVAVYLDSLYIGRALGSVFGIPALWDMGPVLVHEPEETGNPDRIR